jgi:hypothetical protein
MSLPIGTHARKPRDQRGMHRKPKVREHIKSAVPPDPFRRDNLTFVERTQGSIAIRNGTIRATYGEYGSKMS